MATARRKAPKRRAVKRPASRRNTAKFIGPKGIRIYLQRERLDQGGYTSSGRYFGRGAPLYRYYDYDGDVDGHVRGSDRESAMSAVRKMIPSARFTGKP